MHKYLINSLLIVIVLNFAIGCSVVRTKQIIPEKSSYYNYNIHGVVLLDSTVFEFNQDGGQYIPPVDNITGRCINGEVINISTELIKQFRTSPPESINIENLGSQPIKEILLKNGQLIVFDQQDGFYNFNQKEITGTSENGSSINVNINKILQIYVNHPNTISYEDLNKTTKLTQILLKEDNIIYTFDEQGGQYIQKTAKITGLTTDSLFVTVTADSVMYLQIQKVDVAGTVVQNILLSFGILFGLVVLLAGLIALSCSGGRWN